MIQVLLCSRVLLLILASSQVIISSSILSPGLLVLFFTVIVFLRGQLLVIVVILVIELRLWLLPLSRLLCIWLLLRRFLCRKWIVIEQQIVVNTVKSEVHFCELFLCGLHLVTTISCLLAGVRGPTLYLSLLLLLALVRLVRFVFVLDIFHSVHLVIILILLMIYVIVHLLLWSGCRLLLERCVGAWSL